VRPLYDGMVRILVVPTWAKLIDFETTVPSAVEELAPAAGRTSARLRAAACPAHRGSCRSLPTLQSAT